MSTIEALSNAKSIDELAEAIIAYATEHDKLTYRPGYGALSCLREGVVAGASKVIEKANIADTEVMLHEHLAPAVDRLCREAGASDEIHALAWGVLFHAEPALRLKHDSSRRMLSLPDNPLIGSLEFLERFASLADFKSMVKNDLITRELLPSRLNEAWLNVIEFLLTNDTGFSVIYQILNDDTEFARRFAAEYEILANRLSMVAQFTIANTFTRDEGMGAFRSEAARLVAKHALKLPLGNWAISTPSMARMALMDNSIQTFEKVRAITPLSAQHLSEVELFAFAVAEGSRLSDASAPVTYLVQMLSQEEEGQLIDYLRQRAPFFARTKDLPNRLESHNGLTSLLARMQLRHINADEFAEIATSTKIIKQLVQYAGVGKIQELLSSLPEKLQRKTMDVLIEP